MSTKIPEDVVSLLFSEAKRINSPAFIDSDPVQFPRKFSRLQDIEIAALLAAIIAWGKREMICRDATRLFDLMEWQPYNFVAEGEFETIPDERNIHRTLFGSHLKHLLRGLRRIYVDYGSLDALGMNLQLAENDYPAWRLIEELQRVCTQENEGETCSRCLPLDLGKTALKRVNMALRWLVRDDGIVDMGVWKSIRPSQLYIPLDVHVGNVSRELGLLVRKQNDRKAVEELTEVLRELNPEDPVLFDYALFGIGIESKK